MTRLSLVGCLLLALPALGRAELSCTETPFEAGQVASGKVLQHHFTLFNSGPAMIEVTDVKPGCGCLRPHLDQPTFQPGEHGTLSLEINTLTQPGGPNVWGATVHYMENGEPRELVVHVRASLVPIVSVTPATLMIHTRTAASGEFTLIERLPNPLPLRALVSSSDHVTVTAGDPVREGDCWKRPLRLRVLASMPEGRHDDVLKILTGDGQYSELSVPFAVVKRSPDGVQPSPPSLNLMAGEDARFPSRIVMLSNDDDKPVVVERVETTHPFIRCTWATGPGARSTLRVQVDNDKVPADKKFEAAVRVHIVQPVPQVVTIPVLCTKP
jgi:hypothetical protein